MKKTSYSYPLILLCIYLVVLIWSAIHPKTFTVWLAESALALVLVLVLVLSRNRFPLTKLSYTAIFLFLVLHTIGSHYTYGEVPFGYWMQETFGFARNHYDRIVHFSFGLFMAYPIREFFLRIATTRGIWGYWFPVELTFATSAIYEILEWVSAIILSPQAATEFLGSQGDEFDAVKDMAVAGLGALISMTALFIYNARNDMFFFKKIKHSLRVKQREPLKEPHS